MRAGSCLSVRIAAVALLGAAAVCVARGGTDEHARRFKAELVVLLGDARLLRTADWPPHHRRGLRARIVGALSVLRLLAREYLQEQDRDDPDMLALIERLRPTFAAGRLDEFIAQLEQVQRAHPLNIHGLRAQDASPEQRSVGGEIYRSLCMGCHANSDLSRDNPARDLFAQARSLPEAEFIARLLSGIRGTPAIGLANPLSDGEIAGLAAYLAASAN